jgi:hypothetical protein
MAKFTKITQINESAAAKRVAETAEGKGLIAGAAFLELSLRVQKASTDYNCLFLNSTAKTLRDVYEVEPREVTEKLVTNGSHRVIKTKRGFAMLIHESDYEPRSARAETKTPKDAVASLLAKLDS